MSNVLEELVVKVTASTQGLKQGVEEGKGALKGFETDAGQMANSVQNIFGAISFAVVVGKLKAAANEYVEAFNQQEEAETKLETVMRQRMNASEIEISQIKQLASAQQQLGVIGDEVQLAGAQQLSTFLSSTNALKSLVPAMNNLAAQQKGVTATSGDLVSIGNLMGKAMQGQVTALTRVGITMTDTEKKMLTMGTEEERAANLAQIITNNVGQMNAALAQTNGGKIQQLSNSIGDLKEKLGETLSASVIPFVNGTNQLVNAVGSSDLTVKLFVSTIETLTVTLGIISFSKIISELRKVATAIGVTSSSMNSTILVIGSAIFAWNEWTGAWGDTSWADKTKAALMGVATTVGILASILAIAKELTIGNWVTAIAAGLAVSGVVIGLMAAQDTAENSINSEVQQGGEEIRQRTGYTENSDRLDRNERQQRHGSYSYAAVGYKKQYASGGFPEVGQTFIAREAGAELIGNIGSHTAVMNNDQIVTSVSKGVAAAVSRVLGNKNSDRPFIINLDGDTIYSNQQRVKAKRGYDFDGMGGFTR